MDPIPDIHLPASQHLAAGSGLERLLSQALKLRSEGLYALHPVEAIVQSFRASADSPCQQGHGELGFEQAEVHYRAGAQGLRLPEIPQLPQQLRELGRLSVVDRAGRKALRSLATSISLAPKARPIAAQGNALGNCAPNNPEP